MSLEGPPLSSDIELHATFFIATNRTRPGQLQHVRARFVDWVVYEDDSQIAALHTFHALTTNIGHAIEELPVSRNNLSAH